MLSGIIPGSAGARWPGRCRCQPTAWTTWSAHTDNVAYDVETGHFETPDAASDPAPDEDPPCFTGPVIPGCLGSDSDFDGFPYHADWPNGSAAFPTPNLLSSPHSLNRAGFETGTYPTALERVRTVARYGAREDLISLGQWQTK